MCLYANVAEPKLDELELPRPVRVRMETTTLLWIGAVLLVLVGVAGVVLPALPGTPLVFAGLLLAAWIDDFQRISVWTMLVLALLTALAWAVDWVAAALGAKRAGASGLAVLGAAIGTVVGLFSGFIGLIFAPLLGAAVGEYFATRDSARAARVGVATWIALLLAVAIKIALVFTMLGIFAAAYFIA